LIHSVSSTGSWPRGEPGQRVDAPARDAHQVGEAHVLQREPAFNAFAYARSASSMVPTGRAISAAMISVKRARSARCMLGERDQVLRGGADVRRRLAHARRERLQERAALGFLAEGRGDVLAA
jgi:hypothetical protein